MAWPERMADAVVVGGGPGGALAAMHLAKMGWHTVLVEKGLRNREKACGHCLNRRAIAALERAGIDVTSEGQSRGVTQRFRAHAAGGAVIEVPMDGGGRAGLIVDRSVLDQMLRDEAALAGVEVIQPATAKLLTNDGSGAAVEVHNQRERFQIRTGLVIGADGLGSAVARSAGLVRPSGVGRRFGFSFDVASARAAIIPRGTIEMFLSPIGAGYMGLVNCGGGVLHAAALVGRSSEGAARNPLGFVQEISREHDLLRELGLDCMNGASLRHLKAIGPMPWRPWKVACGAVALVGDAAGYVDPFTGEGMGWAIESAELIGQAASRCADRRWTVRASKDYALMWKRNIEARQRLCRAMAWALARPHVAAGLLNVGAKAPWIARRIAAKAVAV